jgi:hypothetical protein
MNPYLLYIRIGIFAVVLCLIVYLGLVVRGWRQDSLALDGVRQEMAALIASQAASQAASKGLQDEIQNLRAARKPAPSVRLCRTAKPVPKAGAGRDGAATGAGELPQEAGSDIGPDLYGLADEADELAARLRACQALLR